MKRKIVNLPCPKGGIRLAAPEAMVACDDDQGPIEASGLFDGRDQLSQMTVLDSHEIVAAFRHVVLVTALGYVDPWFV